MQQILTIPRWLATGATALVLAGCASGVALKPASSIGPSGDNDTREVHSVDGVHIAVQTQQWSGDPGVISDVTPLRVTIRNQSDQPLRVSYDNFALVDANGARYNALPPLAINGSVSKRASTGFSTVTNPGFTSSNFGVAPYYASSYPGMTAYGSAYGYNGSYYNNYYNQWRTYSVALPTQHMRQVAVPDGVVRPGGSVEGFMYFEHVPTDRISGVDFRADLVNVDTGARFGEISIPLVATSQ